MKQYIEILNRYTGYEIPAKLDIPEIKDIKNIVILCHGFGGNKDSEALKIISNKLLDNGIGIVSFDFPNHGSSKVGNEKLTVDNCVSDIRVVKQFINKNFKNSKISLFASSFGAYIAINEFVTENEQFEYVVLRCPAIDMKGILKNTLIKESFQDFKKNGIAKAGFGGRIKVLYSFYEDLNQHIILKKHSCIKQKMLIFHGTADDTAPIEDTIKFVQLNPNITRLVKIPNATHSMTEYDLETICDNIINCMEKREKKQKEHQER